MTGFVEVKTGGLTGAALDWVVAQVEKVEGLVIHKGRPAFERDFDPDCWADESDIEAFKCWQFYTPSTDWGQGGPLIESEELTVEPSAWDWRGACVLWRAQQEGESVYFEHVNLLVAVMRAIAHAKLGDTVSMPKELLS